jgi:hypothetical protein
MKSLQLIAGAAALALSASAVAAQDTSMQPSGSYVAPPPTASSAAVNASGIATDQSSQTPATATSVTTQADGSTLVNNVVTNGPVPDTRANRAKYGRPLSNAGKRTAPIGN